MPSVGIDSMTGSKVPRVRPTSTLARCSRRVTSSNRSASCCSRPIDLTMSAASKLSCATSLTSARSCWARETLGDMARWNTMLARNSSGKTVSPMIAMTGSTSTICTMPATSMMTTPIAIGSGAKTFQVASTSAFALDSS